MSAPVTVAPLATIADLADLPGAPYGERELELACADVRGYCGWHIAPRRVDTLVGSGTDRAKLILPTMRPALITSVRAIGEDGALGTPLTRWRPVTGGMLYRREGWPEGEDNLVAEVEHGFDTCPADLLIVLAERARALRSTRDRDVTAEAKTILGVTRSRSYRTDGPAWGVAATAILDRYRLQR